MPGGTFRRASLRLQNILIHCPDPTVRIAIARHLIDTGSYRLLFVPSEKLTISSVLNNDIELVLLFDPSRLQSMTRLKDFIRKQRNQTRVKILSTKNGRLAANWRDAVNDGLKPVRKRSNLSSHPRFQWKPND